MTAPAVTPKGEGPLRSKQMEVFGTEFPLVGDGERGADWRKWVDKKVREQEGIMRDKRLHWARHRHFRCGRHWIATRDARTWRELDADKNEVRMTLDIVGPSLDFRLGVINEQRPGFKAHPLGFGIHAKEVAEAQQRIAEHYYNRHQMPLITTAAAGAAQTDGVCFLRVYVDKNEGPKEKQVRRVGQDDTRYTELVAQGYEVDEASGEVLLPETEEGDIGPPGAEPVMQALGDLATDIIHAHEVWFDPEARTVNGPYRRAKWAVIMRARDLQSARIETNNPKLQAEDNSLVVDPVLDTMDVHAFGFQRGLPPFPSTRTKTEESTVEYFIYVAPNNDAGLPKGLWRRLVGNVLVEGDDELPGGKIPLARLADGSSDPEMFPRPEMSSWIPDQITVNAMVSKVIEHVRVWAAGRMLKQKGSLIAESFTTITGSAVEYTGTKPDILQSPRVNADVWDSMQFFIKKLEDKTGWNDLARGRVTGDGGGGFEDVSGRAILAAGERLERTFGPMIRAAAQGLTEWSSLIVDYARWLFETPRLITITGRGDLAKKIEGKDLGDESSVYIDPQTLMPMPRALRQQMLFEFLKNGLITPEEFNKRAPYAEVRGIHMGELEQHERAQWVNTVLEERWQELSMLAAQDPMAQYVPEQGGLTVWWWDEPGIHKRALLEIGLDDRKPLPLRDLAMARAAAYDQLERAKGKPGTQTTPPVPPSAMAPPFVRGAPPDLVQPMVPMAQPAGAPAGEEGGANIPQNAPPPGTPAGASGAPEMSGTVLPQASQQSGAVGGAAPRVDVDNLQF